VGDASQPLHVSIHYNGWGDYPNPNGYSENKDVHAHFEGAFVRDHVNAGAVVNLIKPSTETAPRRRSRSADFRHRRRISGRNVEDGAAAVRDRKARRLCRRQLRSGRLYHRPRRRGASELRDLIYLAWLDSANVGVGYPRIPVRDILDGKVTPGASAFGGD